MYKKKEIVKLLILIILVLSIPLIFISLEAIQRLKIVSEINPSTILTNTLDELYQNITSLPKNNDPSTIRKCLAEIFNLMNERNYNKLYNLLTNDMKELMFNTEEEFSDYLETYLKGEKYSPQFSTYQKLNKEENSVFIVNVKFLPYSTDKKDIENNISSSMSDTFTLYIYDNSSYNFSFLSYIGKGESEHKFSNDNFTCKIASTHLYTSQTTFNIEITNKIGTDIFINKGEIYVHTGLMPKYYSSSIFIPANSTKKVQFTIYTGLSLKDSLPREIYFEGVHANGKVCLFYLPIKYPVKISSMYI